MAIHTHAACVPLRITTVLLYSVVFYKLLVVLLVDQSTDFGRMILLFLRQKMVVLLELFL